MSSKPALYGPESELIADAMAGEESGNEDVEPLAEEGAGETREKLEAEDAEDGLRRR